MATYIKTLKEDNGDIVYPQTIADAIYTSGGQSLETEISKYVTAEDIAQSVASFGTVTTGMIDNSAITTAKINDSSVTTSKINNGAVTTSKIDDGAVTSQKIDFTTFPHIVACGRVNIGTVAPSTGKTVTVNIPTQKDTNYFVTTTYSDGGAEYANCEMTVNSRTTTSFTIYCWNTGGNTTGNLNSFYIVTRND